MAILSFDTVRVSNGAGSSGGWAEVRLGVGGGEELVHSHRITRQEALANSLLQDRRRVQPRARQARPRAAPRSRQSLARGREEMARAAQGPSRRILRLGRLSGGGPTVGRRGRACSTSRGSLRNDSCPFHAKTLRLRRARRGFHAKSRSGR